MAKLNWDRARRFSSPGGFRDARVSRPDQVEYEDGSVLLTLRCYECGHGADVRVQPDDIRGKYRCTKCGYVQRL